MTNDPQPGRREVAADVPQNKSPVKFMAALMLVIIVVTVFVLNKQDRRSMKATVVMPVLDATEARGQEIFANHCAGCHGINGEGDTLEGPPLVHPYYHMNSLSDARIKRAIKLGVPQDKWKYGHMAAQVKLGDNEIDDVVAFYNALRRANQLDK